MNGRKGRNLGAISMKRTFKRKRKRGRTALSSSSLVESLAIRQRQPVHARKKHDKASSHPLAGLSSTLMTHRQSWSRINCLLRSRHRCGRRVRSEYGADLEISSSMIVSRVLLGSTVDQVSAVSPALNLTPSEHGLDSRPASQVIFRMEPSCSTCAGYLVVVVALVG